MKTPTIECARIVLKPLCVKDASDIFERWTSDERVSQYVRWSTHKSVEDTILWLQMEEEANLGENSYQWGWIDREKDFLFGGGGFVRNKQGIFELGYNIMYDYWNQGYTTEAVKCMLKFAYEKLNQREFIASYVKGNPASGAVLKKCGFTYEYDCTNEKFDGSEKFECKVCRLKLGNEV